MIRISLFFVFLIVTIHIQAQTYFFDNYKTIDGLESSKIYSICQDDEGYVWLGTDIGVSRFDGSNFVNYSIKDGLAKGGVRVIYKDYEGTLWLGHESGGLSIYKTHRFTAITSLPITSNITSICADRMRNIWITTYGNGAFRINTPSLISSNTSFLQFTGRDLSDMVFNSLLSSNGELYFITDTGIKKYDEKEKAFTRFIPKNLDTYFQFSVLFEDSKQNLWYGTYNGGLYKQDPKTGKVDYYDTKNGLASNWITDITEDREGDIWIAHWDLELRGGLSRISKDGNAKVYNTSNGLHDNKVWCIHEDAEGNILVGTTEHGLDIYKGDKFISYNTLNGLGNDQVTAINQDNKDLLWIGTNGGLSIFNTLMGQFSRFNQSTHQISNLIRFIKTDKNHNIWIGTEDQGVMMYNTQLGRFVTKPDINMRLPRVSKSIWAMEIDDKNQLWIGTIGGLILFDINQDAYVKTYAQIDGLPSNEVISLFKDNKNVLWVGSKNAGISYFQNDKFIPLELSDKISPICMASDKNNRLLIGTEVHGVYVVDKKKEIQRYGMGDGLFSNAIRFIIADDENNIYVGTTAGLNRIQASDNTIFSYSERNGYTGIESKANAAYKDRKGNLWFGTIQGITCYQPNKDHFSTEAPTPFITSMLANGEAVNLDDEHQFTSYQNNLLFNFSSICIANPASIKYKIKLEGSDTEWQDTEGQKSANYRSLPPGDYTFKVMAINANRATSESNASIRFTVLAPFYKRPWFIGTVALLLIISVFTYIKIREASLIKEKQLLATKVKERTQELSLANAQLAEKNKDITDSIVYAKRIQFAIFTPEIPYDETFLFFKPKDIVSGDFYWTGIYHGLEFLAVVDCTGHGVPGAFMSVIGHTSLNKIIIEEGVTKPGEILDHLNAEVTRNLHQKDNDKINDGMDLSLICYNPATRLLQYAGAHNPLWLFRKNEVLITKADRFSIGQNTEMVNTFTNHEIYIEPNDMIYMFSDGYADQFGGPNGKKFKSSQLQKLFYENNHLPVTAQCNLLEKTFVDWKGDLDQLDDILVMGRRFS